MFSYKVQFSAVHSVVVDSFIVK